MAQLLNRLTARHVATLGTGQHADGAGLYLRIDASGAKRWVFIFYYRKARKEMGLGSAFTVSLASARQAAQEAREAVRRGENPIELRRATAASHGLHTFGALADALIKDLEPEWKSAVHRRQWKTALTVHAAALRPLSVAAIGTEDVLGVLKPIWATKSVTASALRGRIERVLDAAKVKGLRTGENPARWRGHLKMLLSNPSKVARGHHKAVSIDDMPGFMTELRELPGEVTAARHCLEFTILTVARTGEAIAAQTSEFDLMRGVWTVPAERMKAGIEHRVALSKRAVEIVRAAWPAEPGYLFPGRKPGAHLTNMAMLTLLKRVMGYTDLTVHGFRSTFKDWATERTSFPNGLSEIALSHKVGDDTELAYRRGDALEKRRRLMEAWSAYSSTVPVGVVVRMRG